VRVQEIRWEGGSTEPAEEYTFLYGKKYDNHKLGATVQIFRNDSKKSKFDSEGN
jgi:hypothetical protein